MEMRSPLARVRGLGAAHEGADGQRVPTRQNLLVASRLRAAGSRIEERLLPLLDQGSYLRLLPIEEARHLFDAFQQFIEGLSLQVA